MRAIRRVIAWAIYFGFLSALGMIVFGYVRNKPRCTITGPLDLRQLSSDGSRLFTCSVRMGMLDGPLQVWNTHDGCVVQELTTDDEKIARLVFSPDGRHLAVADNNNSLLLIDWDSGREWRIDGFPHSGSFSFSPKGDWLRTETLQRHFTQHFVSVKYHRTMIDRDGDFVCFNNEDWPIVIKDDNNGRTHLTLFDPQTGLSKDRDIGAFARPHRCSRDGQLLVTLPVDPDFVPLEDYRLDVWDLATLQRRLTRRVLPQDNVHAGLSVDGQTLAIWTRPKLKPWRVDFVATASGDSISSCTIKTSEGIASGAGVFSPDGSLWYWFFGVDAQQNSVYLQVIDVGTGRVLWESMGAYLARFPERENVAFGENENTGILFHWRPETDRLRLLEPRTGIQKPILQAGIRVREIPPTPSRDGRYCLVYGVESRNREPFFWEGWLEEHWPERFTATQEAILVMDSATGHDLLRIPRVNLASARLSDDGSTLVIVKLIGGEENTVMFHVWDVHPHRAWTWSLSSIVATMLLWFLVSRSLRALRYRMEVASAKRKTTQPTNSHSHPVQ